MVILYTRGYYRGVDRNDYVSKVFDAETREGEGRGKVNEKIKITSLISIAVSVVLIILFVINYFTVFGYYLPHKSQVIYMTRGDISAHFTPQFFLIEDNISPFIYNEPK